MSALRNDDDLSPSRALRNDDLLPRRAFRFRRPDETIKRTQPPVRYTLEASAVPHPPNLAALLRPEHPDIHWALVLRYIFELRQVLGYTPPELEDVHTLRHILAQSCRDERAAAIVRRLVPVATCCQCGREYLRENRQRVHCSDLCRRRAAAGSLGFGTGQPIPNLAACLRCGGPLPEGRRRRYCGQECWRAEKSARWRAGYAARRAMREKGGNNRAI